MTDDRRFERQERFAPLGPEGQRRLGAARALLVGCGATGGVLAQALARAGVGSLVLVDRDVVELSNLPRQVLFDARHAEEGTPKALAAAEALARIGGPTRVVARPAHVDARNVEDLARGADVLLDGTDNLETRYLLNDVALEHGVPWVYCGAVGGEGLVLGVLPGRGPCLRCVFPEPPPPGTLPTCDSAGVILPAVGAAASLAAGVALRVLAGAADALEPALLRVDAWSGDLVRVAAERDPGCPACAAGRRDFLRAPAPPRPVVLCGRDTVQIHSGVRAADFDAIAARLAGVARDLRRAGPILRFSVDGFRLTLFEDGRALVEGTDDPERARAVYDRLVS